MPSLTFVPTRSETSSADSRSQASLGRSTVAGPLVASVAPGLALGLGWGGVVGLVVVASPARERAAQATRASGTRTRRMRTAEG